MRRNLRVAAVILFVLIFGLLTIVAALILQQQEDVSPEESEAAALLVTGKCNSGSVPSCQDVQIGSACSNNGSCVYEFRGLATTDNESCLCLQVTDDCSASSDPKCSGKSIGDACFTGGDGVTLTCKGFGYFDLSGDPDKPMLSCSCGVYKRKVEQTFVKTPIPTKIVISPNAQCGKVCDPDLGASACVTGSTCDPSDIIGDPTGYCELTYCLDNRGTCRGPCELPVTTTPTPTVTFVTQEQPSITPTEELSDPEDDNTVANPKADTEQESGDLVVDPFFPTTTTADDGILECYETGCGESGGGVCATGLICQINRCVNPEAPASRTCEVKEEVIVEEADDSVKGVDSILIIIALACAGGLLLFGAGGILLARKRQDLGLIPDAVATPDNFDSEPLPPLPENQVAFKDEPVPEDDSQQDEPPGIL